MAGRSGIVNGYNAQNGETVSRKPFIWRTDDEFNEPFLHETVVVVRPEPGGEIYYRKLVFWAPIILIH